MNDAITVVGALGGDPIVKSVNGDRVAEFRLACTSRRKENEQWVDGHTNWFSVEAWGGFAEHVGSSLRRGDVVVVLGRLKIDQWESGERRGTSVKIRAEHVGHTLRVGPVMRERRQPQGEAEHRDEAPPPERDAPEREPEPSLVSAGTGAGGEQWQAPVIGDERPF